MKELIRLTHHYEQIHPEERDKYFEAGEDFKDGLADLLLENDSTAVFHVDPKRLSYLGDPKNPVKIFMKPVLLGVNYHHGNSDGDYKIIVQNIPERKGPWVLFRPPGSKEKAFYLQDVTPVISDPRFKEDVANPLKIKRHYLYRGDPLKIFKAFEEKGFNFVDKPMSKEHYDNLLNLSYLSHAK